jgi:hypothetical protein
MENMMSADFLSKSVVRDDDDKLLMMFRGDYRADVLHNGFKVIEIENDGSGGLYFTDNAEIASNYARTKNYADENACEPWRFINVTINDGAREKVVPLGKSNLWLSHAKKAELKRQILLMSDAGNGYEPNGEDPVIGESTFNDYLQRNNKDYAKTVIGLFGESGMIMDGEEFAQTIASLGVFEKVEYVDPYRQQSIVTPVYLDIENPLRTDAHPADFFERMSRLVSSDDETLTHLKSSQGEMMETVVNLTPEFRNALIEMGYDGVMDVGGRVTGGDSHTVYIAFSPDQIRPAYGKEAVEYRQSLSVELASKMGA